MGPSGPGGNLGENTIWLPFFVQGVFTPVRALFFEAENRTIFPGTNFLERDLDTFEVR